MIDLLSVAITLGVLGIGWLVGRHGRLKSAPKQPKPICMCEHHYGDHDPDDGGCGAQVEVTTYVQGVGYRDLWRPCSCGRYTGPQPVEQYWVPPAR